MVSRLLSPYVSVISAPTFYQSRAADRGPPGSPSFTVWRNNMLQHHTDALVSLLQPYSDNAIDRNEDLWKSSPDLLSKRFSGSQEAEIRRLFFEANESILRHSTRGTAWQGYQEGVRAGAKRFRVDPVSVSENQANLSFQLNSDIQISNLSQAFGLYRDSYLRNNLMRLDEEQSSLSSEEFTSIFGLPPWILANQNLSYFDLPFKFHAPDLYSFANVQLSIERTDTDEILEFSLLSSGEKTLFELAIAMFHYNSESRLALPDILLLDEMDSPLHPQMVKRYADAIVQGFVRDRGIACIVTTHSPSTVALFPEECIFEISDRGSVIRKVSKRSAISNLTSGLSTLSIDVSGRRHAFVESDTDVSLFEKIQDILVGRLGRNFQLSFLSTGIRNRKNTEENTGSAIVCKVVSHLQDLSHSNLFGIIDWDNKNKSDKRLRVLAPNKFYAIENILLNPFLLGLLILRERPNGVTLKGAYIFSEVSGWSATTRQALADTIQKRIFPDQEINVTTIFVDTSCIQLSRQFCEINGHILLNLICDNFVEIQDIIKNSRQILLQVICDKVLIDYPGLCPIEFQNIFAEITDFPE